MCWLATVYFLFLRVLGGFQRLNFVADDLRSFFPCFCFQLYGIHIFVIAGLSHLNAFGQHADRTATKKNVAYEIEELRKIYQKPSQGNVKKNMQRMSDDLLDMDYFPINIKTRFPISLENAVRKIGLPVACRQPDLFCYGSMLKPRESARKHGCF